MLNLRRAFSDICRGYTPQMWQKQQVYVKHLSHHDQIDIDAYQDEALEAARARGIATEPERIKWLDTKGFWTRKDQATLENQRTFIDNLLVTKTKGLVKAQRDDVGRQIEEASLKVNEMTKKRVELVGLTAEQIAGSKVQYEYVRRSLFKDQETTRPLFDRVDIMEMSEEDSYEILLFHIKAIEPFTQPNIKRIALSPFFTNYFYLCGEQHTAFFSRPVTDLTFFQVNLLSYGIYYRNMLGQQDVPDHVREDPEKLEEFVQRNRMAREMASKAPATGGRTAIMGAQAEDFREWGMEDGTKEMNDLIKGGGTRDSMEEAKRRGLI